LACFSHQELPFEQIVEAAQPPRSLNHSPVYQVILGLENTRPEALRLPGLEISAHEPEDPAAHVDLSLRLRERDDHLEGSLQYATDLFDRATVERWRGYFLTILEAFADGTSEPIRSVSFVGERERALLDSFNPPARDFQRERF